MSIQLFGDYDDLMSVLKIEIEKTFKKEINSVLNLKIVNGDSRKYDQECSMVIDLDIILKNFDNPDEIRKFEKGEFEDG